MGLFSLFKKPDAPRPPSVPEGEATRLAVNSELERQQQQARQRDIARATAMKIDAIESAMSFDIFNEPEPAWGSPSARPPRPAHPSGGPDTLPLLEQNSTQLLGEDELPAPAVAAQTAPVVEEIAILYANGQSAVAQQMLLASLPDSGPQDRTVWWMLFDLYQLTGQQDAFDNLSIDYASTFETSPPPWRPVLTPPASRAWSGVTPAETLGAVLDARIAPQLQRLRQLAADHPVLRLDASRVTGIEPAGCALLLAALRKLQGPGRELILVAAAELAQRVRATLVVGRRDDSAPCWLLLLELLQLLGREKQFEETAMDYCVTFEVSPPSFEAQPPTQATATAQPAPVLSSGPVVTGAPERFMLPATVEHPAEPLLQTIAAYAEAHQTLVFDCARLARIDFGAANQLHGRLQGWVKDGKKVEFRDVNHLVAALLRLLGYGDMAKLYPPNY